MARVIVHFVEGTQVAISCGPTETVDRVDSVELRGSEILGLYDKNGFVLVYRSKSDVAGLEINGVYLRLSGYPASGEGN